MDISEYTKEIEDLFLQFLYTDAETFVRVKNIIEPTFFEDIDNRKAVEFMLEYTNEHTSLPTSEQIKAIAGFEIEKISDINEEHTDWYRFSLLLSIPVILGAGALKGKELYESGDTVMINDALSVAGLSFLFALVTIASLMAWLRRANFTPFVIYRLFLGGLLLYLIYWAPEFKLF